MSNLSTASLFLFASVQVEEGWWEGVLNGKTGMFPSNFIKELSGESDDLGISQDEQLSKSSKEVPHAGRGWGHRQGLLQPPPLFCSLCLVTVTEAHEYTSGRAALTPAV